MTNPNKANMSVSRVVSASAKAAFAAFTEPTEIRKWHVPGWTGTLESLAKYFG